MDTAALGPLFPAILRAARVVRPERDPTRMRNRCSAQAGKQTGPKDDAPFFDVYTFAEVWKVGFV